MLSGLFASLMVRPPPPATPKLATESFSTEYLKQEQESALSADTKTKGYDTNSAPATLSPIGSVDISDFMRLAKLLEEYAHAISKSVSTLQELENLSEKHLTSLANLVEMTSTHTDIFIGAIRERQIESSTDTSGMLCTPRIKISTRTLVA